MTTPLLGLQRTSGKLTVKGVTVDTPHLQLVVREAYPSGPPHRQLELRCEITNTAPKALCVVSSWMNVSTNQGRTLAEGNIFHTLHSISDWAILRPKAAIEGKIMIGLPPHVLDHIEENRVGGDLELAIRSRILIFEVSEEPKKSRLGAPWQTQFNSGHTISYKIPQSEWVKHLRSMAWSELELLEIPASLVMRKPSMARAFGCLRDAEDCLRRGLWDETLINSRKAFEGLVKETVGDNDMGKASEAFAMLIPNAEKSRCVNELVKGFAKLLALGRHEMQPPVPTGPPEAQVALRTTAALLTYIAAL